MSLNNNADSVTKVLWLGSTSNESGWVVTRLAYNEANPFSVETFSGMDDLLQRLADSQADRIILAPENRFSYPDDFISQLNAHYPEIPIAICLGDYWLGWKRTGAGHLKTLHHCSIPWYRWHDGWLPWLLGLDANMFGPFPADRFQMQFCEPLNLQSDNDSSITKFILFCADQGIAEAWRASLGNQSANVEVVKEIAQDGSRRWNDDLRSIKLVWDDSRLSTWKGSQFAVEQACVELKMIAARFPNQTIWIYWTYPDWPAWKQLEESGIRFELLAKPQLLNSSRDD
ncbi:MAG: hypothetical protein U0930_21730 [Pirellulales bacterium]